MKYALIPAAGSSTRLRELGKQYAKTVLPYQGKTIIEHIIDDIKSGYNPDKIIIGVASEIHKNQIESVVSCIDNVSVVLFDDRYGAKPIPTLNPGPAKTILSTLKLAGPFQDDDEVLIHLSDSLFGSDSVARMKPDSIGYGRLEGDFSRWCLVGETEYGIEFFDKPKEQPPTDKVVSGLYRISSINKLLETIRGLSASGESQISDVLSSYSNKLSLVFAPIAKDFGTLEDYLNNRGISKTRSFNSISDIGNNRLQKSSLYYPDKVAKEAMFMRYAPEEFLSYYPHIHSIDAYGGTFVMEKIRSMNLRELYLYLDRSEKTWDEIFESVYKFILKCNEQVGTGTFWKDVYEKTVTRSARFRGVPEVEQFLKEFDEVLKGWDSYKSTSYFHGDLHFANMFYCFTYKELKLVDPRGEFHGHWIYDLAKLKHSAIGKYDWIDSEMYVRQSFYDNGTDGVETAFNKLLDRLALSDYDKKVLDYVTASLFLSMIPLHDHSEENQKLYYKEFLRLKP